MPEPQTIHIAMHCVEVAPWNGDEVIVTFENLPKEQYGPVGWLNLRLPASLGVAEGWTVTAPLTLTPPTSTESGG